MQDKSTLKLALEIIDVTKEATTHQIGKIFEFIYGKKKEFTIGKKAKDTHPDIALEEQQFCKRDLLITCMYSDFLVEDWSQNNLVQWKVEQIGVQVFPNQMISLCNEIGKPVYYIQMVKEVLPGSDNIFETVVEFEGGVNPANLTEKKSFTRQKMRGAGIKVGVGKECDWVLNAQLDLKTEHCLLRYPYNIQVQQPPGINSQISLSMKNREQQQNKTKSTLFFLKDKQKLQIGCYLFLVTIIKGNFEQIHEELYVPVELNFLGDNQGEQNDVIDEDATVVDINRTFKIMQTVQSVPEVEMEKFDKLIQFWKSGRIKLINPKSLLRSKDFIGQGGFGKVYKGKFLGHDVAIKQQEMSYNDFLSEIKNEIEFGALLSHSPYFPKLYGIYIFPQKEKLYLLIVNELLWQDMTKLMKDQEFRGMDIVEKLQIINEVILGLEEMHKLFIAHRDIKPNNIMFSKDLKPKIVDLGVSVQLPQGETQSNKIQVAGTERYQPSEALDHSKRITSLSGDIYAFGITMYEFLTGQRGWGADDYDTFTTNRYSEKKHPFDPQELESLQDNELTDILKRCVEENIAKRPSITELKEAFSQIYKQRLKKKLMEEKEEQLKNACSSLK